MELAFITELALLRVLVPIGMLLGLRIYIQKENIKVLEKMEKRVTRQEEESSKHTNRVWSLDI